ncbi:MAG TPA: WD40 repeat domain-containing protein, partial [Gemmataceae bacterium]|nr:WD40 repeat domain-containing protein [Gemmataceae bacterium]
EPVILLNSHATQVTALALSGDGRLLASADSGCAIHVWNLETYRTLHVLRGHEAEVRCLAFGADGLLASAGADRVVHLWDAWQGRRRVGGNDTGLARVSVAVSPDGGRLASTGGAALRVWDTATARLLSERPGDGCWQAAAWSPDGRWLAAAGDGPHVELWDAAAGTARFRLEGLQPPVTSLAFAPDSATLAAGSGGCADVWLWNTHDGEPALLIPDAAQGGAVQAVAFHPEGRLVAAAGIDWLATGGSDGVVALWDVPTRRQAAVLPGGAVAVAFHPAGHRVATATLRQAVRVWDLSGGQLLHEITGHTDAVNCLAYSPDGRLLATGGDDRTVRLWDGASGAPRGRASLPTQVKALAFSPDGTLLYTGNGNASCTELEVAGLLDEA